jgi:hypothetical protein
MPPKKKQQISYSTSDDENQVNDSGSASTDEDNNGSATTHEHNHDSGSATTDEEDNANEDYSEEEIPPPTKAATADPLKVLVMNDNLLEYAKEAKEQYERLVRKKSSTIIYKNRAAKKNSITYVVYPFQFVIGRVFLKTKGITALQAPMGSGKTLIAVDIVMQCMRALIVVPTATLGPTWKAEIEDYGLYSPDPSETKIFFYDTSIIQSHRFYLENTNTTFGKNNQLIIVCKDASVHDALAVFRRVGLGGNEFTVIVDEGHMRKLPVLRNVQPLLDSKTLPITRELLMSGSQINLRVNSFNAFRNAFGGTGYQIDHEIKSLIVNPVPEAVWHFDIMPTARYEGKDPAAWEKKIKAIAINYKHPVFVGTKEENAAFKQAGVFGKKEVFIMTKAAGKIAKFEASRNAVMFLNKVQVTGLNINGDAMIITNPGLATTEYILQLLGRIFRPKNKNKYVHIYLLCGSNKEFFRCLYAKAFSFPKWEFGRESDVNAAMVAKGVAFIRALGQSPVEINRVDLCVMLADYLELEAEGVDAEYMIEWWQKNSRKEKIKTVLTENMIRDLVTI